MELFSENVSVSGCLIEHIHEIRVIKDVLDLLRRKQVLDILCDTRRNAAPFTETLPDLSGILRCLFLLEKQMELVDIVASDLLFLTVGGNPVPHGILHDEHTDLFELVAKLLNIKADDTIAHINIGAMIKEVLAAVYEHLQRVCHSQSDFALLMKLSLQIREKWHLVLRRFILNEVLVDTLNTLINDRAFLRRKSVAAADNDLTQGDQEVRLVRNDFHRIAEHIVINGDVHRVDVLFRVAGDTDKLSVECRNKRKILTFGIADDNIVHGCQKAVEDLTLNAETLACTWRTEDKSVRVFEP